MTKEEKAKQKEMLNALEKEMKKHPPKIRKKADAADAPLIGKTVPCDLECETKASRMNAEAREAQLERQRQLAEAKLDTRTGEFYGKATNVQGDVFYIPEGEKTPRKLKEGQILVKSDKIMTGSSGKVQLKKGDGTAVVVGHRTSLDLDGSDRPPRRTNTVGVLG